MFDPSKVSKHQPWIECGINDEIVTAEDFDACAAALAEALASLEERDSQLTQAQADGEALAEQRNAAVRVVKEYRRGSLRHDRCMTGQFYPGLGVCDDRCTACKAADEVLEGKS